MSAAPTALDVYSRSPHLAVWADIWPPGPTALSLHDWVASIHMKVLRLKAFTSEGSSSNHSPFFRFAANRLCQ